MKITILLNDTDRYFLLGLKHLLTDFFLTQNKEVYFIENDKIAQPDIIFNNELVNYGGVFCSTYSLKSCHCIYFSLINKNKRKCSLFFSKNCERKKWAIYHHQGVDEIKLLLQHAINLQNIKKRETVKCLNCPRPLLSRRERDVLMLINLGMKQTQIASHLLVNVKTINSHKRSAMKKLCLNDNFSLLSWMLLGGLSFL
ncbi:helix-turn-helix transcriptional regulator [Serratia liquefaciens]|uniref:helix-turn-helix transcriptional regulator n=1 Tax=Serratia liquefaciens TaxID=614 RepID=UPI002177CD65|nr:LuxR family transcriptional regulator [Serratia liquefaciens]CAI1148246.1 Nitrogen regulation protein C [Serratia liquefaciens]